MNIATVRSTNSISGMSEPNELTHCPIIDREQLHPFSSGSRMPDYLANLSGAARQAAFRKDWVTVDQCAREIMRYDNQNAEGLFLSGLVSKAAGRNESAVQAFSASLSLDAGRYDAAIELADQLSADRQFAEAATLVEKFEDKLRNSPLYLNMAGTVFSRIGMPERAWPLYKRADELQPGVALFQANIASCAVFLGRIDEARRLYEQLLERFPTHQRYHYQLARLDRAQDTRHAEHMKSVLETTKLPDDRNIFMFFALGKEFEDLEDWDAAFYYYKRACDAVMSVANYDIESDLKLIDTVIQVCNRDWLKMHANEFAQESSDKLPIFIVGLPRTGTTLTERIIASHSKVQSVGETQFMQMVLRRESGVESEEKMTPEMIRAASKLDVRMIGNGYMRMLIYRLGNEPIFIDKLPLNLLYLGFIAKAFPHAKIVHVQRNPMDSCFAMYKQVFAWAYKFSYSFDSLARFYQAYLRLLEHWQLLFGDRIIGIEYESLVRNQETETRKLIEALGLPFEAACLNFDQNETAAATASAVQVREKVHTRSVDRWKHFETHLQPLRDALEQHGVSVGL